MGNTAFYLVNLGDTWEKKHKAVFHDAEEINLMLLGEDGEDGQHRSILQLCLARGTPPPTRNDN